MSHKKRRPKKQFEERRSNIDMPRSKMKAEPEVYSALEYLNIELKKSQRIIYVLKKEHCQLRDGFIWLISKMAEQQPDIEKELAAYYATNHNLSGRVELNDYNIDSEERKAV